MIENVKFPAKSGGRETHRPQRMTDILLAISECTLAVLPSLPPVNGGQSHEEGTFWKRSHQGCPTRGVEIRTALQAMFSWCVMINSGTVLDAAEGRQERISLRRVQVPA